MITCKNKNIHLNYWRDHKILSNKQSDFMNLSYHNLHILVNELRKISNFDAKDQTSEIKFNQATESWSILG